MGKQIDRPTIDRWVMDWIDRQVDIIKSYCRLSLNVIQFYASKHKKRRHGEMGEQIDLQIDRWMGDGFDRLDRQVDY